MSTASSTTVKRRWRRNLSYPGSCSGTSEQAAGAAGVPFSWEDQPGIPKPQLPNCSAAACKLPLPPAAGRRSYSGISIRRNINVDIPDEDPFLTALLECSKDVDHHHQRLPRKSSVISEHKLAGRLMNYIQQGQLSCRKSCPVSESAIVHLRSRGFYKLRPPT